ncbi:MAG: hypothetical protein Q8P39_01870, partial [Candidatus Yanofskybacteria bacterium]|nr:hypothetical protein [Candidatus Yanofskybacteria bacterium]
MSHISLTKFPQYLLYASFVYVLLVASLFFAGAQAAENISVQLQASPSSGPAPLNGVDVTVTVSGAQTNGGPIAYRIDCTSDGTWDFTESTNATQITKSGLCSYEQEGNYLLVAQVEQDGKKAAEALNIQVTSSSQTTVASGHTLSASLAASPSSGTAPLNDVSLKATVSGSATGEIIYRFDCTSNG